MTWYDELTAWLARERKRAHLEDAILNAALSHAITWKHAGYWLQRR
jgi:hypothetical protein